MAELLKVDASRFEDVHELLRAFENPRVRREQWRSLFEPRWGRDEGYAGYALADGGRIVGFLGYLFSTREVRAEPREFCNLSSWIVDPAHRAESLKLVLPALKLRGCTVTNLTPRPSVAAILSKLGFRELDAGVRAMPSVPLPAGGRGEVVTDEAEIARSLEGSEAALFRDHRTSVCGHLLVRETGASCYLVHVKRRYRGIAFTHVLHVSAPEVLARNSGRVRWALARIRGTAVTLVDERFLGAAELPWSFRKAFPAPILFRPAAGVGPEDVDDLYSELALLPV